MIGDACQFQQFADLVLGIYSCGFALLVGLAPRVAFGQDFSDSVVSVFQDFGDPVVSVLADVVQDGPGYEASEEDEQHDEGENGRSAA